MMIRRYVQTHEHNMQAIMFVPIICTDHKLQNNNGSKVPVFPRYTYVTDARIWWYDHMRHTTMKWYDNNGKVDTSEEDGNN